MLYAPNPTPSFPTRHWAALWRNNIESLQELKQQASSTVFIAIDLEGYKESREDSSLYELSEIGITAISLSDERSLPDPPTTLPELLQGFDVQTFDIPVVGRRSTNQGFCEGFLDRDLRFSDPVLPQEVDAAIHAALESLRPTITHKPSARGSHHPKALSRPFTLIGWDLNVELSMLSRHCPLALKHFESWVDLQEIAEDVTETKRKMKMRECLLAFGLTPKRGLVRGEFNVKHRASNDTTRMVVVLLHLLAMDHGETIRFDPEMRARAAYHHAPRWREKQLHWFSRQQPPTNLYPFVSRVTLRDVKGEKLTCKVLRSEFSRFEPVAFGDDGQPEQKSTSPSGGWVCLSSVDALEEFVKEVDGLERTGGGVWQAVSAFDPEVTTAHSQQELSAQLAERKASEINIQREQGKHEKDKRKKEREKTAERDELDVLVDGMDFSLGIDENIRM